MRQRASRASVLEVGPAGVLALVASPFGRGVLGVLGKLPWPAGGQQEPYSVGAALLLLVLGKQSCKQITYVT